VALRELSDLEFNARDRFPEFIDSGVNEQTVLNSRIKFPKNGVDVRDGAVELGLE
jgi:hypothetical protein